MQIGVPKEIKNGEHRVAITPDGVRALVADGHRLLIQAGAGADSGFADDLYRRAGAMLTEKAEEAWGCELVVKVKEPLAEEYRYLNADSGLFTFLHLAAVPELTRKLLDARVRSIGYETVEPDQGGLPILAPMSKVAGRVAMLMAARLLQFGSVHGHLLEGVRHKGILTGGIRGVDACRVVILGGGNVGRHAAYVAAGLAAEVVVLDHNLACIDHLNGLFGVGVQASLYAESDLGLLLSEADVVIGAALIPGEHAPQLITGAMVESMQSGTVFMDVAIDQGGISETSRVTSYDDPVYAVHGVIHSCLPNLPASVPRSSTQALVAASLPYLKTVANEGLEGAIEKSAALKRGVNTWDGEIVHAGVLKAFSSR
ncbi:MAG: alanine dehydrogenase [Mariprofundaceae bacterium]|nr:alanine dehydrogenase [Mariprofundaceae bacterium]